MNNNFTNENFLKDVKISFKNKTQFNETGIALEPLPFQTCEISNFIVDENEVKYLIHEVNNLEFCGRNNDLYSFQQSNDLNYIKEKFISKFRNLLKHEFKEWLQNVTGIQLKPEINLTASKYKLNDVLLCHDDELDTRRIAFTYYLTPENWTKEFGGLLRLFNLNESGEPEKVVREIIPSQNKMVWFEVSEDSYHEVSEVLSQTDDRLSLHGWFHSEPVPRKLKTKEPVCPYFSPIHVELELVYDWVNTQYLDTASQDKIREKFENLSEIQLPNFLKNEKYSNLLGILSKDNLLWDAVGPSNKRHYDRLTEIEDEELMKFLDLFKSEAMLLILSNFTGLNLHPLYEERNPSNSDEDGDDIPNKRPKIECETSTNDIRSRFSYELRRWSHGSYQLMHDTDSSQASPSRFSLDALMYFTNEKIDFEMGGYTSYISSEDGEQLLTVEPNKNCLNLAYTQRDIRKFVKYVNNSISQRNFHHFYDSHFSYIEEE